MGFPDRTLKVLHRNRIGYPIKPELSAISSEHIESNKTPTREQPFTNSSAVGSNSSQTIGQLFPKSLPAFYLLSPNRFPTVYQLFPDAPSGFTNSSQTFPDTVSVNVRSCPIRKKPLKSGYSGWDFTGSGINPVKALQIWVCPIWYYVAAACSSGVMTPPGLIRDLPETYQR